MRGPNLASMAWRNLWRNRRRTLLTLLSISLGGFLAVLFTALQDRSFADFIDTAARLGSGHVTVEHPESLDTPTLTRTVANSATVRALGLQDPDVRRAVVRISGPVMLATARDSYGAFFIAFDPGAEDDSTMSFAGALIDGELFTSAGDKRIVLGERLARNLGVELGSKVVYTLTDKHGAIVAGMARVGGILRTGTPSLDGGLCLLPIGAVREILGYSASESTQVALFLADSRDSAAVARRLNAVLPLQTTAFTWDETQAQLAGFIALKVGAGRAMEIIIMILIAAGIFNTMFVSVMERLREFGIMMAIGFGPGQLFRLVIWESVWLALVGLIGGAMVTVGPYLYLARKGIDASAMTAGGAAEVAGVAFNPILRAGIYPENLVIIAVAVLIATLLAGLYPASRAGRVVPVESIKLV